MWILEINIKSSRLQSGEGEGCTYTNVTREGMNIVTIK
jgi:hypothetical protein